MKNPSETANFMDKLTVIDFFRKGQACGDPLNVCDYRAKTPDTALSLVSRTFSFNAEKMVGTDKILPAGYFCVHNTTQTIITSEKYQYLTLNHTTSTEMPVFSMKSWEGVSIEDSTKREEEKIYTTEFYNEVSLVEEFNSSDEPGKFILHDLTTEAQFGYINLKTRDISESTFEFSMVQIKAISLLSSVSVGLLAYNSIWI